ncbi:MAG: hypothetical protein K0U52_06875 [Gammaproteobacteria bacterium]|nr:hypothetical protein [Gammaproteobacteria bacterium]
MSAPRSMSGSGMNSGLGLGFGAGLGADSRFSAAKTCSSDMESGNSTRRPLTSMVRGMVAPTA